ncbi:hypothetical protein DFP72DRAFT_295094 [Ephemerocybe angulata]|uniref:Secreted protein n=1 Tax=Ephemerocybe angulata TaxID=980116 RepID=A0A8H6I010_9AGAR|nr:hypothetical protein DFP72DRAFT_295094 [Tulosesus angulatus]
MFSLLLSVGLVSFISYSRSLLSTSSRTYYYQHSLSSYGEFGDICESDSHLLSAPSSQTRYYQHSLSSSQHSMPYAISVRSPSWLSKFWSRFRGALIIRSRECRLMPLHR